MIRKFWKPHYLCLHEFAYDRAVTIGVRTVQLSGVAAGSALTVSPHINPVVAIAGGLTWLTYRTKKELIAANQANVGRLRNEQDRYLKAAHFFPKQIRFSEAIIAESANLLRIKPPRFLPELDHYRDRHGKLQIPPINAYAIAMKEERVIGIGASTLAQVSQCDVANILFHEIGHCVAEDGSKLLFDNVLNRFYRNAMVATGASAGLMWLQGNGISALAFGTCTLIVLEVLKSINQFHSHILSRHNEFQADRVAEWLSMRAVKNKWISKRFHQTLGRIEALNGSRLNLVETTHPYTSRRIAKLRKLKPRFN